LLGALVATRRARPARLHSLFAARAAFDQY
jgi:hypothetical protein